jgi:hypothetical protein
MNYTSGAVILDSDSGSSGPRSLGFYNGALQLNSKGVTGGPVGTNIIPTGSTFLYGYILDTTISMYYNGTFDASGEAFTFSDGLTTTIGAGYYNGSMGGYLNGSISEIVIYNRVLTTLERQKVEGYLAWKWSIEAQLPEGHPYKSAAP